MTDPTPTDPHHGVRDLLIEDEMRESYLRYAMSVIVSRALPDVRDGLKPSQRRILVAMNDLNLSPRSKFRKCAKIAGDTSGNYHPHGEAVVYPTLVRMAQDFVMRQQLIEPQGNFGTLDDPPAAMRYTEARLGEAAMEMLADIEEDTVDFVPNYDESRTEPTVLPARFPNLLVNGAQGIAVGMASSIAPHNVREVCSGVIALLDNPEIDLAGLMQHIPGPDFPTGATICGRSGILDAYETGRGHLTLRAKCETEEGKGDKFHLIFKELPHGVSVNTVCEQIVALVNDKKMTSIADVRDESSMADGTRLVVELKRGENDQVALNQLYKHTRLQETFGIIAIALVDGRPETLRLKQFLELFRDHRIIVIRRRTRFRLQKAEDRAHIVEGLLLALDVIDWIITTIRSSKTVPEAKECLISGISPTGVAAMHQGRHVRFSLTQAEAILDMRLARLTGLERDKLLAEWAELQQLIAEYRAILADRAKVIALIRQDMLDLIAKFPDGRRTQIVADASEVRMEDLIADDQVAVTISHEGYVKRLALTEYRLQGRGGKGVTGADMKEGDFVERLIVTTNHQYLLVLTQTGQMHWLRVFDIPEASRTSRGRALVNMLQIAQGDRIAACVPVRNFDAGYLITATSHGTVRKTPLSGFSRPRQGGIIGVGIDAGDSLIGAAALMPGQEVVLTTANGKSIHFKELAVRATGRASFGVRGIRLITDDKLVSLVIVEPGKQLLTVCEKGFGKRTAIEKYPLKNRGGQGVKDIEVTERNGRVVGAKCVAESDEFIMITEKGMVVRSRIADVRVIGRNTQGVRLMNVEDDDRVVSIGLVESEEVTPVVPPDAAPTEAVSDDAGSEPSADDAPADDDVSDDVSDDAADDESSAEDASE
ncbi:MAG: DNA gyrase subunit A [Planctomycetes bacterium]|nr:DNA gyrase subunit A [Planctomycetota bacterium]